MHKHKHICMYQCIYDKVLCAFDVTQYDQTTHNRSTRRKRTVRESSEEWLSVCKYNDKQLVFVTATPTRVRFWNALTGCLKDEYEDLVTSRDGGCLKQLWKIQQQ